MSRPVIRLLRRFPPRCAAELRHRHNISHRTVLCCVVALLPLCSWTVSSFEQFRRQAISRHNIPHRTTLLSFAVARPFPSELFCRTVFSSDRFPPRRIVMMPIMLTVDHARCRTSTPYPKLPHAVFLPSRPIAKPLSAVGSYHRYTIPHRTTLLSCTNV